MATYLITGASRGLGLALLSVLFSLPETEVGTIFAAARQDNSAELKELSKRFPGRVIFVQLDVIDEKSVKQAARSVEQILNGKGLDILINNAGVMPWTHQGLEGMEDLNDTFNINVTGVHLVTREFLPLLRKGAKKVANISSSVASIGRSALYMSTPIPAYKISKAALNMLTVQYAHTYADEGFAFVAISPGWLQTDMGGSGADLPPETGAKEILRIIEGANRDNSGRFLNIHAPGWENNEGFNPYDGKELPW